MPAKKSKSKISFKAFAAHNHSRFTSRFPFLKEPQIKAKLLQAWRSLTSEVKHKQQKHVSFVDSQLNRDESDSLEVKQEVPEQKLYRSRKVANLSVQTSTDRTHSVREENNSCSRKRRTEADVSGSQTRPKSAARYPGARSSAKKVAWERDIQNDHPSSKTRQRNDECVKTFEAIKKESLVIETEEESEAEKESKSAVRYPGARPGAKKVAWERDIQDDHQSPETRQSNENECVKMFEAVKREHLIVEPEEESEAKIECRENLGGFNPQEWLNRLAERGRTEKETGSKETRRQETGSACGMLKWRADGKTNMNREDEESITNELRFFRSNEYEGESNFCTMFDEDEAIFL